MLLVFEVGTGTLCSFRVVFSVIVTVLQVDEERVWRSSRQQGFASGVDVGVRFSLLISLGETLMLPQQVRTAASLPLLRAPAWTLQLFAHTRAALGTTARSRH